MVTNISEEVTASILRVVLYTSTLKMDEISSSEMLVTTYNTRMNRINYLE
jgi:hypothetical protein